MNLIEYTAEDLAKYTGLKMVRCSRHLIMLRGQHDCPNGKQAEYTVSIDPITPLDEYCNEYKLQFSGRTSHGLNDEYDLRGTIEANLWKTLKEWTDSIIF